MKNYTQLRAVKKETILNHQCKVKVGFLTLVTKQSVKAHSTVCQSQRLHTCP